MKNLKEANEEISRLKDEIKKIKAKNIKNFSTKDLHDELIMRGGVETIVLDPYWNVIVKILVSVSSWICLSDDESKFSSLKIIVCLLL